MFEQTSSIFAQPSVQLSAGLQRLQVTLKVTTAILALAAGVYTYLGVRELLNGNATMVFFAAVIYSVAVSVGIYAFWVFLMQFMPHVVTARGRALMFGCMALGSLMIVAMSSWLNASALAGAWLGGTLIYEDEIGVDHAQREVPDGWVNMMAETELREGQIGLIDSNHR